MACKRPWGAGSAVERGAGRLGPGAVPTLGAQAAEVRGHPVPAGRHRRQALPGHRGGQRGGESALAPGRRRLVQRGPGPRGGGQHPLPGGRPGGADRRRPHPFADREFDLVVVVDFLEHIPDDRGFAAELGRILKPGGRLIVNVPREPRWSLVWPCATPSASPTSGTAICAPATGKIAWRPCLSPGLRSRRRAPIARLSPSCWTRRSILGMSSKNAARARGLHGQGHGGDPGRLAKGGAGAMKALYPAMRAWTALDGLCLFSRDIA